MAEITSEELMEKLEEFNEPPVEELPNSEEEEEGTEEDEPLSGPGNTPSIIPDPVQFESLSYRKRPPSNVPRSDGRVPAMEGVLEQVVENRAQFLKEAVPTAKEIRTEAVKQIAINEAEKSRERLALNAIAQQKADKTFRKDFPATMIPEHQENVRVMNEYKNKYSKKGAQQINFKWRMKYDVTMDPGVVAAERREVEILLGAQNIPTIIKEVSLKLVEILEIGLKYFGGEEYNIDGANQRL
jgi:hypothetical protein